MKRILASALGLIAASAATADVVTWSPPGPSFADWTDPANWSPETVPGPFDTAVLDLEVSNIQLLASDPPLEVGRLLVPSGDAFLDIRNPGALDVSGGSPFAPAIVVGSDGQALLEIRIDSAIGILRAGVVAIGGGGGPARFTMERVGFAEPDEIAVEFDILEVGAGSRGTVVISEATLSARRMRVGTGAEGTVEGDTPFGRLRVTEQLDIGSAFQGTAFRLPIDAARLNVATLPGSFGVIQECAIDVTGDADLGVRDVAVVEIETMTVGGDLTIGTFATFDKEPFPVLGQGVVTVLGGGTLDVAGDLVTGLLGSCDLELHSTARVTVGGSVDSVPFAPAADTRTVAFRLDAPESGSPIDPILLVGQDAFLPRLEVRLAPGFIPAAGNTWALTESGGATEWTALSLPTIPEDLEWSLSLDAGRLVLTVLGGTDAADVNGDGIVGLGDLLAVLAAWGPCPGGDPCPADVDGDGAVGLSDLLSVLAAWD